jgi:hypothetical protein
MTGFDERERDLDAYRKYVADAAEVIPGEVFLNRYVEHAAIIVEYLFRKAQDTVEILTGRLNPAIYGTHDTVRAAIDFLDRTARRESHQEPRLYILTEDGIDQHTHPLLLRARETQFLKQIELRQVPDTIKSTYNFHFTVADNMHYRCKESRGIQEAVVQFNSPDAGLRLHSEFRRVHELSELIALA